MQPKSIWKTAQSDTAIFVQNGEISKNQQTFFKKGGAFAPIFKLLL